MTAAAKVYCDGAALASSVSRRLRTQSLVDRSVTEGSRIAGYPITYPGYRVRALTEIEPDTVRVSVRFEAGSSDMSHRREAALEHQAQRTVWLRSWLIEHGMDEWTIGDVEQDNWNSGLRFTVTAPQGWR